MFVFRLNFAGDGICVLGRVWRLADIDGRYADVWI